MVVRFWGVRGSIPSPVTPQTIRNKISSVLQRVRAEDLESPASRERFLASLPPWLFGTYGGNSACIEARMSDNTCVLLDAGSGIREFSVAAGKEPRPAVAYHVFITHFHYDHIQGLPFFGPAYNPNASVTFYSPEEDAEHIIRQHMSPPYFPVRMDEVMRGRITFQRLGAEPVRVGTGRVTWKPHKHPGGAVAYRVEEDGRAFVFSTDAELQHSDFEKNPSNRAFYGNVDMVIMDSQYTLGEAIEKYDWGHSSFSLAVDFVTAWNIRQLFLYHHDPNYDDQRLYRNLQSARWYANNLGNTELEVYISEEGLEIEL